MPNKLLIRPMLTSDKLLIFSGASMAILSIPIFGNMESGGTWSISLGLCALAILFATINAVGGLRLLSPISQ